MILYIKWASRVSQNPQNFLKARYARRYARRYAIRLLCAIPEASSASATRQKARFSSPERCESSAAKFCPSSLATDWSTLSSGAASGTRRAVAPERAASEPRYIWHGPSCPSAGHGLHSNSTLSTPVCQRSGHSNEPPCRPHFTPKEVGPPEAPQRILTCSAGRFQLVRAILRGRER